MRDRVHGLSGRRKRKQEGPESKRNQDQSQRGRKASADLGKVAATMRVVGDEDSRAVLLRAHHTV